MYTGKHQKGYKVVKHTKTKEYYIISHPMDRNRLTGNATVSIRDVMKFDKNFIFQYYGDDNKLKTILIGRRQVCDHCFPCYKRNIDDWGETISVSKWYMIKIEDIFKYGREITL